MIHFHELRKLNVGRVALFGHSLTEWNPLEWAGAMCGEAGEAANVAKKLRRMSQGCNVNTGGDYEELTAKLAEEVADVVIYADLLLASVGRDLAEAVVQKFNVVSERVGFPYKLTPTPPASRGCRSERQSYKREGDEQRPENGPQREATKGEHIVAGLALRGDNVTLAAAIDRAIESAVHESLAGLFKLADVVRAQTESANNLQARSTK